MYEATYMKRLRTTKFIEKTEEWLPETGGGRKEIQMEIRDRQEDGEGKTERKNYGI